MKLCQSHASFFSTQLVEFCSEFVCGQSEPFVSMKSAPVPHLPHPTAPPNHHPSSPLLICNLTKLHFSECLAHRGLQSFHWPAHTRSALRARLGTDPKAFVKGRTKTPEDSAAMRIVLSERADEFSHVYVGCTGQKNITLECELCTKSILYLCGFISPYSLDSAF